MEAWLCKCVWAVAVGGWEGGIIAAGDESTQLPVLLLMTSD